VCVVATRQCTTLDANNSVHMRQVKLHLYAIVLAGVCLGAAQDGPTLKKPAPAAEASDPTTTISVKVKVVNVLATVRDKSGKIVNDLNKNDFILSEDGRPQSIHYFTRETDLPLTLGLLVDTSMSQRRVLDQERSASHSFLDQMVREDRDQAFIIHFDREVELLQDLTASHQKLEQALGLLQTPQYEPRSGGGNGGGGGGNWPGGTGGPGRHGGHHGGGTMLYDAVYLASDELMRKQEGRKALVLTRSSLRMTRRTDTVAVSTGPASVFPVEAVGLGADVVARVAHKAVAPTGRKSSNGCRQKPGGACSRFPKNKRSIRSTPRSPASCAISTTLDMPPIGRPRMTPAITGSKSR